MPSVAVETPWLGSYPGHMPIPTMVARSEIDYLHWLATRYTGVGRIIDMGCLFGGSTLPLAKGLASNRVAASRPNIITYDSFVMVADTVPRFPLGLRDGDSFRPVFETYLRDHLDCITVREGWLPSSLEPGGALQLYPEQEPVEILFIDIAKLWPVHETILRTFGPHLIPDTSIVIQQDFKHHGCYWLGLHMHQLRECFEPLHNVAGGASVSFLYRGGLENVDLLRREDLPASAIERAWDEVDRYWADRAETSIRLIQRLAAATHLVEAGLADESVEYLRRFEQEFRAALPLPEEVAADIEVLGWDFASACRRIADTTGHPGAIELAAGCQRRAAAAHAGRDACRRAAIDRCLANGHDTIALFGAGRHTAELLASGWPYGRLSITAILDDFSGAAEIGGIPVMRPEVIPAAATAVLISSDASEDALYSAAARAINDRPIIRIYS